MVPCWIWYLERRSRDKNILGGEIAERKIPIDKMLFETNTNGHNHPCISLIIIEQDTIDETKENNKWLSTQEPRTPQNQSYRPWWGAASSILNDTPCVYIYIRPIIWTHGWTLRHIFLPAKLIFCSLFLPDNLIQYKRRDFPPMARIIW